MLMMLLNGYNYCTTKVQYIFYTDTLIYFGVSITMSSMSQAKLMIPKLCSSCSKGVDKCKTQEPPLCV
jgi:hypothetical protein